MRNLYAFALAFLLTTATLFAATEVLARTVEDCKKFFNSYIGPVVDARDSGVPPAMMFNQLVMVGVPQPLANNIIGMIYVVHEDNDKEFIENDYMNWCVPVSASN